MANCFETLFLKQELFDLIILILEMVLGVTLLIIVSLFVYHLIGESNTKNSTKIFKCLIIMAAISCVICTFVRIMVSIIDHFDIYKQTDDKSKYSIIINSCDNLTISDIKSMVRVTLITQSIATGINYVLIYLVYWQRLLLVFKGSIFAISSKKQAILSIFAIILIILNMINNVLVFYENNTRWIYLNTSIFYLVYYIACIFLCIELISTMIESNKITSKNGINTVSINVILKITILAVTTIVSSIIVSILVGLNVIIKNRILLYFWLSVDAVINVVCLYLQFQFSAKYYIKLCFYCHRYSYYKCRKSQSVTQDVDNKDLAVES